MSRVDDEAKMDRAYADIEPEHLEDELDPEERAEYRRARGRRSARQSAKARRQLERGGLLGRTDHGDIG